MSTYYLRVQDEDNIRKILIDMAYLAKHKVIRLPKYYYEEGLYLPYFDKNRNDTKLNKYELSKVNIFKEDDNFFYFKFPFKHDQVVEAAV